MSEPTAGDLSRIRERLEQEAALSLGRAVFAISRLDASLGMMVASIYRNTGREAKLDKIEAMSFHNRLSFVSDYVTRIRDFSPDATHEVKRWFEEANDLRLARNQLVHGRWDIDVQRQLVTTVVGLPSSSNQRTHEYSLTELASLSAAASDLQARLTRARMRWHLP